MSLVYRHIPLSSSALKCHFVATGLGTSVLGASVILELGGGAECGRLTGRGADRAVGAKRGGRALHGGNVARSGRA
jgi:hypothetical protein